MKHAVGFLVALSVARLASAQTSQGRPRHRQQERIDAPRDVAIKDGEIAASPAGHSPNVAGSETTTNHWRSAAKS